VGKEERINFYGKRSNKTRGEEAGMGKLQSAFFCEAVSLKIDSDFVK
jgi:hypothetical protein